MNCKILICLSVCFLFVSCFIFISGAISASNVQPEKKCILYSGDVDAINRQDCKKCHQKAARFILAQGGKHSKVTCRKCHLPVEKTIKETSTQEETIKETSTQEETIEEMSIKEETIGDTSTQVETIVETSTQKEKIGETFTQEDILPKCIRCHKEKQHGDDLIDCKSCHTKAHAPRNIPAGVALAEGCYVCHEKINKDVKTFITLHTELYCTGCHNTKHRNKSNCLECHQTHKGTFPTAGGMYEVTTIFSRCLNCHPPHKALKVVFPDDIPAPICSTCHRKAHEMLQSNISKHSAFQCNRCHPGKHQTIKRCNDCHGNPHAEMKLKKFNACGECHGVAHSVVKAFLASKQICVNCHVNRTAEYAEANNLWLHAPVTKENCIFCHHHHPRSSQSPIPYLLRNIPEKLCTTCHSKGLIRQSKSHQESNDCIKCHNPHLGKNKSLLIKDYKEEKRLPKPASPFPDRPPLPGDK